MRETSRKPDEIYDMIDRLAGPETRKIRPGWLTLGNQLPGVRDDFELAEDDVQARVRDTLKRDGMLNSTLAYIWNNSLSHDLQVEP